MKILGIDNVFFNVQDLNQSANFFEKLGFIRKLDIPHIPAILFSIGLEEAGLIICEVKGPLSPSKLWVEVENAEDMKSECDMLGIQGKIIQTGTGKTLEITDHSGNVIGFADYTNNPQLSRSKKLPTVRSKQIAEKFTDGIWNKKQMELIDLFLHKEAAVHSALGIFYGRQAMRDVVSVWLKAFPDLNMKITDIIGNNDFAVVHWTVHAKHLGEFKGVKASGKPVSYSGATIYRIKNDMIIEYWAYLDMQHILAQIR